MVEETTKKQPGGITGKGFMPGVSGNPAGRPVGTVSIVEGLRRKLLEIDPETKRTYLDLFMETYVKKSIKDGDSKLIVDYINRIDGMAKQSVDMNGNMTVNEIKFTRK